MFIICIYLNVVPKKWSQSLPLWSCIVILQIIVVKWNTTDAAAIAKNKEGVLRLWLQTLYWKL
jgi:cyanate permease